MDEVTGEWRKLGNGELNDLYFSQNVIRVVRSRRMRRVVHVARMGKRRGVYKVLVENPEGKRSLGRFCRRREGNIKVDLQDVGWRDMDWTDMAQNWNRCQTLVNEVMKFKFP
jgi:hypothetical protein